MAIRIPSAAIGLATGFVQGFTRNIQTEQGIRFKEQERLDRVTDAITSAILDPGDNFNSAAVKALQASVQETQKEMDERGNIDIFGRAGPRINIDYDNVLSTINSVGQSKLNVGGYALDDGIDFLTDASVKNAYPFLRNMTKIFSDPANVALLNDKSRNDINEINAAMKTARRVIQEDSLQSGTSESGTKLFSYPNLFGSGYGKNPMFPGIENWDNFAKEYYKGTRVQTDTPKIVNDLSEVIEQLQEETDQEIHSVGMGITKTTKSGESVVTHQTLSFKNPDMIKAHDELAAALGLEKEQKKALLTYWQTSFMALPGDPDEIPEYTKNALVGAIRFGLKMTRPDLITVERVRTSLATDGKFVKVFANALDNATVDQDDVQSQVYALAPYLPGPDQDTQESPGLVGQTEEIQAITIQNYVLKKIFGPDSKDIKFKEFIDGQKDLDMAVNDLQELKKMFLSFLKDKNNLNADGTFTNDAMNLAYEDFKKKVKFFFGVDQGMVGNIFDDLKGMIGSDGVTDGRMFENEDGMTDEYMAYLQNKIDSQTDTRLAKLEAMRISLAFRMARAADPSGRLSNQDIEIQLRKLGTNFSTINQALSALDVSIKEFTIKQQQYAVFNRYSSEDRKATRTDLKVIDAAIVIDELTRGLNAVGKRGSTVKEGEVPEETKITDDNGVPLYFFDTNGVLMDRSFNEITDQNIINAMKKLGASNT